MNAVISWTLYYYYLTLVYCDHYLLRFARSNSESNRNIYSYYKMVKQIKHNCSMMKTKCQAIPNHFREEFHIHS